MRRYAALAVLVIAGVLVWRCRGREHATVVADGGVAKPSSLRRARPPVDVAALTRAAISGTVTGERGPLAGARVCVTGESAELPDDAVREPSCATTGANGTYRIDGLLPAAYYASAVLRGMEPAVWGDKGQARAIRVRDGERRGIDFALSPGGVELIGTVSDLTGGPIDKAHVWADESQLVETDDKGGFALWVKPGIVVVHASADGYADAVEDVWVPSGAVARGEPMRADLALTPEATLAGTVIDGSTREPVAGVRVIVGTSNFGWDEGATTFTDDQGRFRVGKLVPKRYVITARTSTGYGRAPTVLVGLAQNVEGVVVELYPAFRIDGRIVDTSTNSDCEHGAQVALQERSTNKFMDLRRAGDGSHFIDGVLPGTYGVTIYCSGARVRETYAPIEIRDRDATGLVWEVDRGAVLKGTITARGKPVEGASVSAQREGAGPRERHTGGGTASRSDGSYEVGGLAPGTYKVVVAAEKAIVARETFTIELVDVVTHDVVLAPEDAGTIAGTIVDSDGRLLGDAEVSATALTGKLATTRSDQTGASGAFQIGPLRPGDYKLAVYARDTLVRKSGTTDDTNQGERVTVTAGTTSTVKLVVEAQTGRIAGTVVDAAGAAVSDAFVSAARESDAAGATNSGAYQTRWSWNERPVVTAMDGAFMLTKLAPGNYTIRAYRRGGGEAIAEHVAVGGTAKLAIKSTGSIAGRVLGAPDEFAITVRELATGFRRREELFHTGGAYALKDLPRGRYLVIAEARTGIAQLELELREGEARSGVDFTLDAYVTATGRVVELGTGKPIAGVTMSIRRVRGGGVVAASEDHDHVSDVAGRFTVRTAPQGQVVVTGWGDARVPYEVQVFRQLRGSGTVELGDVEAVKHRLKDDEIAGDLGLKFAEQAFDTPPDKRERKVSYIDPKGPAAKTGIVVGDVVVAIDGIDVKNEHAGRAAQLLAAPPGTKVTLTLARGPTVAIVLGNP